jgi:vacuolar-type H+-ATPase subunit E/Vma4
MTPDSLDLEARLIDRTVDRRNEIIAEAEKRAETILKAAERECERISEDSDRQVLNVVSSELRAVRDRIIGNAELEGRKILMQAREEAISSVFKEAQNQLWRIGEGKDEAVNYGEVLSKLVLEAAEAMGGDVFTVSANERDLQQLKRDLIDLNDRIKEILGGGVIRLGESPAIIMGGVIIQNEDGTKIYHNTLEGRLRKVRSGFEAEVATALGVI